LFNANAKADGVDTDLGDLDPVDNFGDSDVDITLVDGGDVTAPVVNDAFGDDDVVVATKVDDDGI
jgi:hypothetical protein